MKGDIKNTILGLFKNNWEHIENSFDMIDSILKRNVKT